MSVIIFNENKADQTSSQKQPADYIQLSELKRFAHLASAAEQQDIDKIVSLWCDGVHIPLGAAENLYMLFMAGYIAGQRSMQ